MSEIIKLKLSRNEVKDVIRHIYKKCEIMNIKSLSRGLMSFVFEVKIKNPKKKFILKISNIEGRYGLAKEVYVVELLKKHKIPCPKILYYNYSRKEYQFDILIMEKLKGQNLKDIWDKLSKKNQISIVFRLGKILARINSIKFKRFALIKGYKEFTYRKDAYEDFDRCLRIDYPKFIKEGVINKKTFNRIKKVYLKYKRLLKSLKNPVLTHNDLWFDHVFVRKVGDYYQIEAIIDFGFAFIFPKEADFVKPQRWIFDKGKGIEEAFLKGYQTIIKLDGNFDTILSLYRIQYDAAFMNRLHKTKQFKLKKKYEKIMDGFLTKLEKKKNLF